MKIPLLIRFDLELKYLPNKNESFSIFPLYFVSIQRSKHVIRWIGYGTVQLKAVRHLFTGINLILNLKKNWIDSPELSTNREFIFLDEIYI